MATGNEAERDERLLPELDEASARLLFPERFPSPMRVTLRYPPLDGDAAERAAPLLAHGEVERTSDPTQAGDPPLEAATFGLDAVEPLHDLYQLVREAVGDAGVEVLIDGRRLSQGPVRDLWLPLLWCLRS